ncbi:MAG: GGDEF domain-containing protein [Phycisphaerae bacterium]|nr:MAG: GGDEF domain-containing protein [Phycisphaerae bacterium]
MQAPDLSPDEPMRLAAVRKLNLIETPLQERFERITRLAKQLMRVEIAAISLVEADRQWFVSIQGLDECVTGRDESFCGHTILETDVMVVPDAREDPRFFDNPLVIGPPYIAYYAACPILSNDGFPIGTLCLIDPSPRETDDADVENIRDLAALAQSELQSASANAVQASLLEDIDVGHRRSLVDCLTRMWNRDGILNLAEEALEQARSGDKGAAFVMVDLDHFKEVNDSLGHAAGDEVLRAISRRMLGGLRETDVIGRIGGDEFLLVLSPCESFDHAVGVVDRIQERITASPIHTESGNVPAAASMGIAFAAPGETSDLDSLLKIADSELYQCKRRRHGSVPVSAK